MAYKKVVEENILKRTISRQLEARAAKSAAIKQKSFAPAEEAKASNGLNNLFSKLFRQKEGLVIADQKISAKESEEKQLEFGEFKDNPDKSLENTVELSLSAFSEPLNKNLDVKLQEDISGVKQQANQELKAGFDGVNQLEDESQELQEGLTEVNPFNETIEELQANEAKQDTSQELKDGLTEGNQFNGTIEELQVNEAKQDASQELQDGLTEVNQFNGTIEELQVNEAKQDATQELQEGLTEGNPFNGTIEELQVNEAKQDATQELQEGLTESKQFQGKIEEKQKETLAQKKGESVDPKLAVKFEDNIKISAKNIVNKTEPLKQKQENFQPPIVSVSVITDEEGKIIGLNKFINVQASKLARSKGYSGKRKLANVTKRAKKRARISSDENGGKISISR